MKTCILFPFVILSLSILACHAAVTPLADLDSELTARMTADNITRVERLVDENGCNPNICFALDGSGSINTTEWDLEKGFVKQIIGVVSFDPEGKYAAVQYGLRLHRITQRLSSNADRALIDVDNAEQKFAGKTFIAPGLGYCIRQLSRAPGQPNQIVLLGDGRSNFDSRLPPLDPRSIASNWVAGGENRAITGVAVNFEDNASYMRNIVGSGNVFAVNGWFEVTSILEDLIVDICGWEGVEF